MKDYFGKSLEDLKNKKLFLFDMDGTIYLGNKLFDGITMLLEKIKYHQAKFVFITNNSSKSVKDYIIKLNNLGIYEIDEQNFFTSTQASINLLKNKFKAPYIYAQGTKSFIAELKKHFKVTEEYDENVDVILVGFDPEITGKKLENTSKMLTLSKPYYATNPDWVCPTEYGYIPDCGSMCQAYERASGKTPIFIGKPTPRMIEEVIRNFNVKKEEVVVIGDRIYTDIASGYNAGVDTICVLSGEVTIDDVLNSDIKPTYTMNIISQLNEIL